MSISATIYQNLEKEKEKTEINETYEQIIQEVEEKAGTIPVLSEDAPKGDWTDQAQQMK